PLHAPTPHLLLHSFPTRRSSDLDEFPDISDPALRGTASIGRRLQDPLSELVKIDPQHVGVGLYQHDVSSKHLKEMLEGVIESCVDRKSTRLNSSHVSISYAVFCL